MHQLLTVATVADRLAVSERTVKLNEATPVMMTFDEWITETHGPNHGLSGAELSIAREAWDAAHEQCATTYGSSKAADEIDRLRAALRQVAQSHAWIAFGECRSFGCDVPLLQPHQADALAKEVLMSYDEHQAMWPQMIAALAAIDEAIGLPADGRNSIAQTLYRIRNMRAAEDKCNDYIVDNARISAENKKLRHLLFVAHGSSEHYLYGERTCNTCMVDFNRDSAEEIERKIHDYNMRKLAQFVC